MPGLEEKAKELVDHFELLVHRFVLQSSANDLCGHLSKQELRVVDTLGKNGPCIMSEIADRIVLAVSSVTGIVDKLVEKKLVHRERSDDDRRIVRVELTPEGQELYQVARENRIKMGRAMLSSLDEHEQDALLALFRKITHKVMAGNQRISQGT